MKLFFLILLISLCLSCKRDNPQELKSSNFSVILLDITGKNFRDISLKIPTNLIIHVSSKETDFTFTKKFDKNDIKLSNFCIGFVEKLTGLKYDKNFNNIYWSDNLFTNGFLGMTVYQKGKIPWSSYIAIASEIKPTDLHNLNQIKDFGLVLAHEFSHSKNLHPEVPISIIIDKSINISFNYYMGTPVTNFFVFGEINKTNSYDNILEKIAYESNILPPWIYERDYEKQESHRLIFLIPEFNSTNNN